ncbi:hypothetical protein EVAR_75805_1 [Eumeta japonica]|uniref:Uncharacterized protein n=1 Tax=Eumeta variegata TaxID=151549 RepID=A0A4C1TD05_EUMVA|nr:hypothetical protein EVAR_75805_1 [Eumeta japonica]
MGWAKAELFIYDKAFPRRQEENSNFMHALKIATSKLNNGIEKHLIALLLIPSRPGAFLVLSDFTSVWTSLSETGARSSLGSREVLENLFLDATDMSDVGRGSVRALSLYRVCKALCYLRVVYGPELSGF